jgi:tetratricopeptide (TPR) repeat protein
MGEDDLARGQFAVARTAFEDAYRTTAEQLARNPNDPARIYAHAQSEYWVGEVHRRLRDWRGASAYFRRYAQAAERLVQLEPANPDFLMEAGYGASNMGTVQLNGERDPAAAQASFTRALQWFRRAEQARPGDRTALRKQANAYANIADTFYARRQWRDALAARQRQYAIYLPLHEASPNDMEVLYDLATAERAVGRHFSILQENNAAAPFMVSAYRHARVLRDRDPRNATWLALKARLECDFLLGSPGRGQLIPDALLRRNIGDAVRELGARLDPRASEISSCLTVSGRAPDARQIGGQ